MISVAVIDDEPLARQAILTRLLQHRDVHVDGEFGDGLAALQALQARPVDVMFVDVQMPGLNGLALLSALAACQPLAILLTAHASFAVDAFALGAVDYLLKPIDSLRFDEALARTRQRLAWRRSPGLALAKRDWPQRFAVRVGRKERYVAVSEVQWIEADGDYVTLHLGLQNEGLLLRESLHAIAEQLDPTLFVRVHRSAIVRISEIAELKPMTNRDAMLRLRNGTSVRVSRTYIDALMTALHRTT
jgi:two-component system, LytTR family, response regulator